MRPVFSGLNVLQRYIILAMNTVSTWVIEFFASIVVLDLVVIPWRYVFDNYAKAIFKPEDERGWSTTEQARAAGASIGR